MIRTSNEPGAAGILMCCALLALAPATGGAENGSRAGRAIDGVIQKAPLNRQPRPRTGQRGGGLCGNGAPDQGEECDDGNLADGDGCSSGCLVEAGFECTAAVPGTSGANVVSEPGFESGAPNPAWVESSATFGTPLCTEASCGLSDGTGAFEGSWWGWFGYIDLFVETASLSQTVTIPTTATTLAFQLGIPASGTTGFLTASIDGNVLATFTEADGPFIGYRLESIDITAFADGSSHLLSFDSTTDGNGAGITDFFVDAVVISDNLGGDPPTPSVCMALGELCTSDDFDTEAGDLTGWTLFNFGAPPADWGTTDDGVCWRGFFGPPPALNVTGGTGEAACIDSDANSDGPVDAYLCSPAFDTSAVVNPRVRFKYNYQVDGPAELGDFFEVLHGSAEPGPLTIDGYTTGFSTSTNAGGLATPPGASETVSISDGDAYACFRYGGDFEWYAQVDDFELRGDSCGGGDTDGDGINDDADNCINVFNPSQDDSNGDGIGNSCDADTAEPNDCVVNFRDLGVMKSVFFSDDPDNDLSGGGPMNTEPDGTVDFTDLGALKADFFADYTVDNPSGISNICDGSR